MLITFQAETLFGLSPEKLVALCGALFILPFFLFSGQAGQLADAKSKSGLAAVTKVWEIAILALGALAFALHSLSGLLLVLFLLGVQATFFGPIKYGIIPELVLPKEMLGVNALIELGTFVAILSGTLVGGVLISAGSSGPFWICVVMLAAAVLGLLASRKMIQTPAQTPNLRVALNPITPTVDLFRSAWKSKLVFGTLVAISWFWLVGSIVLSILPTLAKDSIGGSESMLSFFLALFSMGVAFGSILCERMSQTRFGTQLIAYGAIGMAIFSIDIGLIELPRADTISLLLSGVSGWRLSIDLFLFSVMAGIFTVPLYTLMQSASADSERSRVVAANNVMNALFMVMGAILLIALYSFGLSSGQVFLVLGVANLFVGVGLFRNSPFKKA